MSTANVNIEAIYPLSHMQQGMLFHTLLAPESEVYFDQASWSFQGEVNVAAFQQAWQQVVERHPVLRTAFIWKRRDKPLQVVRQQVDLPWEVLDWRGRPRAEQEQQLDKFLYDDRARGFDLAKPPLMRFALIQLDDELWHFAWSFHHILVDGWGASLLLKEVFSFYEAYARGQHLELARPRPYRDYIGWLQRQDIGKAEAYWRRRLKGFKTPTPLGIDRFTNNRGPEQAAYADQSAHIPEHTSRELENLGRRQQVTLNTVVQGAWALLLSRYSGQLDVLFGATVTGRPAELAGVEQMVGLFINSLPIRIEVNGEAEVGQWLQQLQREQAEMRQYEYSPLVEVQGWSEVKRGVPLFESILVFENYPIPKLDRENGQNGGASVPEIRRFQLTNYPITIRVAVEKRWAIGITYDTNRFENQAIARMLEHFRIILEEIAANPRRLLSEMSLLTKAERQQLLVEWNNTETEFPCEGYLHQLFEAQAARTPAATALVYKDQSLTYSDLNARANQLAHHLRTLGVGPETVVAIYMQRSVELVVSLLAILKAGGAYLALDPEHPRQRVSFMLADSAATLVLTERALAETLQEPSARTFCVDADWALIAGHSKENPESPINPSQLAYLIYTSGTTGRPKAVMIEHDSISNSLLASQAAFNLSAQDAVPCTASFCFDISLFELMSPLMVGARSLMLDHADVLDPEQFCLQVEDATFMHAVPALMKRFLSHVKERRLESRYRLRKLFVGGDLVSPELMALMAEVFPAAERYTGYGPTEATIMCTNYRFAEGEQMQGHVIGRPMANMKVRLYDEQRQLVPIGVGGELYIGGRGVARGYRNAVGMTREKFVEIEGERYYRTGDVARYREGGVLEFVRRIDEQVKVRGYRVETAEIETVLREQAGVNDCVVAARDEKATGEKRLVAYVVARPAPQTPTAGELRTSLTEKLPPYMIPSAFVFMEQLPLTSNGKVDRQALPEPEPTQPIRTGEYVRPRTPVEELMAIIWSEVLKLPQVGAHDNFFELGGHSLLATQVVSRLRESFQIEVPLRAVFEAPTVAKLSAYVEAALKDSHGLSVPPIVPVSRAEELPLSFAQHRLWFLDQLDPLTATYNMPAVVRLHGPLKVDVFERALREIIRRHESLRTRFVAEQGRARQVICEPYPFNVTLIDLSNLAADEREAGVPRLAAEEARRPFDLSEVPLLRVRVLRLGEDDHILFFTMHHIISDGWSTTVLMRELGVLYDAFSKGEASPLPELKIQYADFAAWQRNWLQGEVLEKQLGYWKRQLADVPEELKLPTDRPRPAVQTFRGATHSLTLTRELTQGLKALSQREGSTLYMSLLAAFQTLLSRYAGQTDITVGTPIANRNRSEIEGLIGFFVNTLVLRTEVDGEATVRQMIGRVREVCLGAYAHQDVPFELLVEELQPERDLSRSPLFQVMFVLQNLPQEITTSTGLAMSPVEFESKTAKFDLSFFWAEADTLNGTIEYNTDLFDPQTIVRILGHFQTLLEGLVANPERKLSDLPLLTEGERQQVLVEWNETNSTYSSDACLAALFEREAERRPEAVAVAFGHQRVTYQELNRRANQLAHRLQRSGIASDSLVAVCVERSIELVVALLGVLKAGGAYVPVDPSYPQERLAFMLDDAQVSVLLTQDELVDQLPQTDAAILRLDADWADISQESETNPFSDLTPENLAYMIYTSGSTGKPKGVQIPHRAVVNFLESMRREPGMTEDDTLLAVTSLSFDIAALEIFLPLVVGGSIVLASREEATDGFRLSQLLSDSGASIMQATPATWQMLFEAGWKGSDRLTVLCGGEALPRRLANQLRSSSATLWNMYGPTETTIWSTISHLDSDDGAVTIGRPIANTQIYILDDRLQPTPVGVPGDLYIGGDGLARGYLNRPELTSDRFVPHPFSDTPGARLYRTGDLARWLSDGNIIYEGRQDYQVKIRGHRIELGEIEAALEEHQAVKRSVVTAYSERPGETNNSSLVAYLVLDTHLQPAGAQETGLRLAQWQEVWNETYGQPSAPEQATFNIAGWNSSYTGQPIPAEEMREWVEATVERILAQRPKSILEIGCGTGLLLFRVAPHCESYCGTDFSEVTLNQLRQQLSSADTPLPNVTLLQKEAADFEGIPAQSFDTIVLNSVIQYFPGIEYLLRVLENAARVVRPGGTIFIGDVRSLPLLETFHASVQLAQAPDSLPTAQLQERIRKHLREEEELVIDPAFFVRLKQLLPQVGRVEVQLKGGRYQNELTKFRYDVVLHVGSEDEAEDVFEQLDWQHESLTRQAIKQRLAESQAGTIFVRNVPNARLRSELQLIEMLADANRPETVGELRRALQSIENDGEEPEDFLALSEDSPYAVSLTWAEDGRADYFDLIFSRDASAPASDTQTLTAEPFAELSPAAREGVAWETYANNPLLGKWTRNLVSHLRDYVGGRLPGYMVPSNYVVLESFPLTPNGKIDRRRLPAPDSARRENKNEYVAPSTPAEEILVKVWSEVLRLEKVGVNDNFFELGGDSILSVQVVARAKEAGLALTPKDLFQHQTVAKLAAAAGSAPLAPEEQGIVSGEVELTPIQHWFFRQQTTDPHYFNQSLLLELRQPIDPQLLRSAAERLVLHHDALRLRFSLSDAGWRQSHAPADEPVSFYVVTLSDVEPALQRRAIEEAASQAQSSLDISAGPLLRFIYFDLGDSAPARLLVVAHHLVIDGVSWRILLEDLQRACQQLSGGEEIHLPTKTTSFQRWAAALSEYARSRVVAEQISYWTAPERRHLPPLPLDYEGVDNLSVDSASVAVALSADETRALLKDVPSVYRTQINDLLLTALAESLRRWTGSRRVLIDLEGHGRETINDNLDVSRTVGWFTSIYPLLLEMSSDWEAGPALKSVKEQLRAVPAQGIGYGVLRYLSGDGEVLEQLDTLPQAEVSFNYLGQVDQVLGGESLFAIAPESAGGHSGLRGARQHLIEVNSVVVGGRLQLDWTYSRKLHRRETIERVAESFIEILKSIIGHCLEADAGGVTPSDFPLARLSQEELDALVSEQEDIVDLYPLTPMQQGMLFHCLYAPATEVYFNQLSSPVSGRINPENFRRAWQEVLDRHTVLRTGFRWSGLEQPLQVVYGQVSLPWEHLDWKELSPDEQGERLSAYLREDRRRGIDLTKPPLMRVALIQLGEDQWQVVWSYHHIVMDGWCMPLVLKEFAAVYEAFELNQNPPPAASLPFSNYIAWLQKQDMAKAEEFWRRTLRGVATPTPLELYHAPAGVGGVSAGPGEQTIRLSEDATARLESLSRQHQLTLNTLIQGAWGLLLSRYSGESDVMFGTTVAGRPAELKGVEKMLGLFINTLPVRVEVDGEQTVLDWLKRLQSQQVEARQYEYTPLMKIQEWSDVPRGLPLFQSILAFENYPVENPLGRRGQDAGLEMPEVKLFQTTNYPLSLMVWPAGSRLAVQLSYDAHFEEATVKRMLAHLEGLLESILTTPAQRVSDLSLLTVSERRRLLLEWNGTATELPHDLCLQQLFEAQVASTPANTALACGDEHLTYDQLNQRANRLAHYLQSIGVGPETLVALYLERSIECVVAMFAVLKAGGAFVPLDTEYPLERLSFMIANSAAPILLTQASLSERLPEHAGRTVQLDLERDVIAEQSAENPAPRLTPDNLAYLIYTSGTSGRPKAVMVEHRSLMNTLLAAQSEFGFNEQDVVPCVASFSFDISLFELFSPLLVGACSILLNRKEALDLERFTSVLEKASFVHLTPGLMRQLVDYLKSRSARPDLSRVRQVFTGGDLVPHDLLPDMAEAFPSARLFIGYGPTEGAIMCTGYHVPADAPLQRRHIIGRPLNNVTLRLYDRQGQLVPVGVAGELYLGGAGVARGYLRSPELTAEKFVVRDGERFYRTGDLARYLDDGNLEFLGRVDQQVKIRGYRVEVEEIEKVLSEHSGVRECVVVARKDASGEKRLAAYVVPSRGESKAPANGQNGASGNDDVQLWPSIGEYFVYDELIYYGLTNDEPRNQIYQAAIQRAVKDKVVVDIGTGRDAILARLCADAGARRVYAIEILEESFKAAKERVEALGLADRIIVMHGDASSLSLPEKADVCVSEIVESIGGAEGAATIINNTRRLLKEDAVILPERSVTKIAAVRLPDELVHEPCFTEVSAHYVERIFAEVGHKFDLRLCVKNFPVANIISNSGIFEDLDFRTETKAEFSHEVSLTIDQDSTLNGFLLWLNLHLVEGEVIDILDGRYSWFPVYFPVFHPGVEVSAGDVIKAVCRGVLSENGVAPGYILEGSLIKQNGESIDFKYDSHNHRQHYRQTPFYDHLFRSDSIPAREARRPAHNEEAQQPVINDKELKDHLRQYLPEYMVPSAFVMLEGLPLTHNGKVDRRALPAPNEERRPAAVRSFVAPRNKTEIKLKEIWEEMLSVRPIGITDNFFELGGDSLLALRLVGQVQKQFGHELPVSVVVTDGTIKGMASLIEKKKEQVWSPLVAIQPEGERLPFYCVHAGGGNVLGFYELAKCLGTEQPFYGLQAPGLVEGQEPLTRIEDFAACYIRAIREFQPDGPYLIGGYSSGGIIAFEMAQQLRREGHEVGLVAMLDSFRMTADRSKDDGDDARLISIFARTLGRLLPVEELRQIEPGKQIDYALERGRETKLIRSFVEEQQLLKTFHHLKALKVATQNYRPQVYPGTITLFRPVETTSEILHNVDRLSRLTNLLAGALAGILLLASGAVYFGLLPWSLLAVLAAILMVGCFILGLMARRDVLELPSARFKGLARLKPLRAVGGGFYYLRALRGDLKGEFDLGTDLTLGWAEISAKPIEVHEVPGNHLSIILKPDVQALADSLNNSFSNFNKESFR